MVALGLGVGLIPVADERFFDRFPPAAANFLHNGVMLGDSRHGRGVSTCP